MNGASNGALVFALGLIAITGTTAAPPGPAELGGVDADSVIEINADGQQREGDLTTAWGRPVDVRYRDQILQADEIVLDTRTKDIVATGNVVLQQGERRMVGERLEFNLETRLGRLWQAWGYVDPDLYITANQLNKVGDRRFELRGASVTSCNQPTPQWRIKAARGVYEEDRYVRLWHARFEIFGVPILYLPFFQYPARQERSTGFLFPSFGESNQRGISIANSFFWAMGRSYDATFTHEWYKESGNTVRSEFRYSPSRDMGGVLATDHFFPKNADGASHRVRLTHNQRMGSLWRAGATIDYATDDTIDRQLSQNISRISQRRRQSRAFLERNWSRYSLRLSGAHQVFFSGDREDAQYQLPEFSFGVRDSRILGPLYGGVQFLGGSYGIDRQEQDARNWGRADLAPSVSLPWNPVPWLGLRAQGQYRLTYWSQSFAADSSRQVAVDDGFLRRFGQFNVSLSGPIFQRIFHTPGSSYSDKYKHQIEPVVAFQYAEAGDPDGRSQSLDVVDRLGQTKVQRLDFLIRNRLLARRSFYPNSPRTPHELLLFELGTSLDLERDTDSLAPLFGSLRVVPTQSLIATYRFQYDLDDSYFPSHLAQVTYRGDSRHLDVSYGQRGNGDRTTTEDLRATLGTDIWQRRMTLGGSVSYDLFGAELRDLRLDLMYRTQCCGFGFGYRRLKFGTRDDNEMQFSVTLKNIGTVLDYTFGENGY